MPELLSKHAVENMLTELDNLDSEKNKIRTKEKYRQLLNELSQRCY